MLSNKKIIELFNRLKSRKNAWLGLRDNYRTLISIEELSHSEDERTTRVRKAGYFFI